MAVQTTINPQGPGTSHSGPIMSGPRAAASDNNAFGNQGMALLAQVVLLAQNGTAAVSRTCQIPRHTQIVDFYVDTTTIWDSATSATLSIGTAAADTTYVNGLALASVTAANGRLKPTFNTTQIAAIGDTGTVETVVFTVTPVGATTVGSTFVTMLYRQTQNYINN
jgi:hypothetical protein